LLAVVNLEHERVFAWGCALAEERHVDFDCADGQRANPSWCLDVSTTYFAPARRKRFAHADGAKFWNYCKL
jgi:hypothetical protein